MQRATDEVQRLTESLQLAGGADGDESWMRELNVGDRVDVVVNVGLNHFRGRSSVEWTIRDFQTVP